MVKLSCYSTGYIVVLKCAVSDGRIYISKNINILKMVCTCDCYGISKLLYNYIMMYSPAVRVVVTAASVYRLCKIMSPMFT
jgi:hypothetical protein